MKKKKAWVRGWVWVKGYWGAKAQLGEGGLGLERGERADERDVTGGDRDQRGERSAE